MGSTGLEKGDRRCQNRWEKKRNKTAAKSDKKNINHTDNSIESQTDGPGSILEIKDLCFAYPEEEKRALNHISFQIKEGEFLDAVRQERMWKKYAVKTYEDTADTARKTKRRNPFDGKNLHEMTGRGTESENRLRSAKPGQSDRDRQSVA